MAGAAALVSVAALVMATLVCMKLNNLEKKSSDSNHEEGGHKGKPKSPSKKKIAHKDGAAVGKVPSHGKINQMYCANPSPNMSGKASSKEKATKNSGTLNKNKHTTVSGKANSKPKMTNNQVCKKKSPEVEQASEFPDTGTSATE